MAQATASTHRFQPAHAPQASTCVRDCIALGAQAPQMQMNAAGIASPGAKMISEFVK